MQVLLLKEVDDIIQTLQKPTQAKWLRQLTLLTHYGKDLGMPHVRQVRGRMRELRVRGSQEIRAFFLITEDQTVIVHAFVKKTQKIPQREIDTAQKRLSSLLTTI